ncbi:predicted protein [Histoplasma capsulatum H143]|uniref:Uncharacterized protein n=1 Tax=Ajellomyces capsulatus (strain H143) TaxID=544712 RepID=C6HCE7_AJECH|nr:predicted protein [Histoplasma capsulatum H143]
MATDQTAFFTSGGSSVGLAGPLEVTPPPKLDQGSAIPAPSQRQVPLVGFPPVPCDRSHLSPAGRGTCPHGMWAVDPPRLLLAHGAHWPTAQRRARPTAVAWPAGGSGPT